MFPFLTAYDPKSSAEGTLDPLGLYTLADQLAQLLVPAVRERMMRIRFLTPMAVGSMLTETIGENPRHPESPPFLIWEWLVIEAFVRSLADGDGYWGIPGTNVTKRALNKYKYLDYQNYLKTPYVFGFHGVYKRLADRIGLLDMHLQNRGERSEELVSAWANDIGIGEFNHRNKLFVQWQDAIKRSLDQNPVRSRPRFSTSDWKEIYACFIPHTLDRREGKVLESMLLGQNPDHSLGALKYFWNIFKYSEPEDFTDDQFLAEVGRIAPEYAALAKAIQSYERFARNLADAFEILRFSGSQNEAIGYDLKTIGKNRDFASIAAVVPRHYRNAVRDLQSIEGKDVLLQRQLGEFGDQVEPADFAVLLAEHHEKIQRQKSEPGKRPWFDHIGSSGIIMRGNYRRSQMPALTNTFVHQYRRLPVHRFYRDMK